VNTLLSVYIGVNGEEIKGTPFIYLFFYIIFLSFILILLNDRENGVEDKEIK
jgi:hypothetical protein